MLPFTPDLVEAIRLIYATFQPESYVAAPSGTPTPGAKASPPEVPHCRAICLSASVKLMKVLGSHDCIRGRSISTLNEMAGSTYRAVVHVGLQAQSLPNIVSTTHRTIVLLLCNFCYH